MNYSSKVYTKAQAELQRRRSRAEHDGRIRREEAYAKVPALVEIDREISSAGVQVVRAIGMGENAQRFIEALARTNLDAQRRKREMLKSAGFTEDYLDVKYVCPKCRDTGYVSGIMCECYQKLIRETALAQLSELSPSETSDFSNFSLSYYPDREDAESGVNPRRKMDEILHFCRSYAEDFATDSPSLIMYGATGLGKTHLSLAIAKKCVEKGYDVIYGSAQNLLNRLERERFSSGRDNEFRGSEQELLECDLLIIDDLGAEFSTQFTVSAIYNIVNTRLLHRLPVIISTNLPPEELERKYTQRITSRIIGSYVALYFCGKDIRQLKNNY